MAICLRDASLLVASLKMGCIVLTLICIVIPGVAGVQNVDVQKENV